MASMIWGRQWPQRVVKAAGFALDWRQNNGSEGPLAQHMGLQGWMYARQWRWRRASRSK